uniref:Uncharacterized protein n=1 Tax=viral metagenome TaxID=1070528 RepID=A0A6C0HVW6_9ZZZZ
MSRRSLVKSGSTVDAEVANLFKLQNKSQFTNTLLSLRQRYRDEDLVNKIQDVFMQKHSQIVKSAKKFAMAVRNKYSSQNVPFHQLLMKARAHAKKHHLSEAEFSEFQRIYEQELAGTGSGEVVIPMTSIMKVLGNITNGSDAFFNSNEADSRNLQEIIRLNEMSRPLHAQVLLQAIQYAVPDNATLAGMNFDKNINNPADHVHPVVAALFLPKFKTIDEHFLYSNMSGIIKCRYNQQPLTTRPDYELFYNLVTDPNDVVCDIRTPVADLLHRCNLQNQLWNSVLHLRNGQIYNPSLREFTASVDVCRLNKYDNPDFVYGRHDGTILKRLFSAFSFRPTIVATIPVANLFAYNPYSQSVRPTVTSIPMINVRLSNFGAVASAAVATASGTTTTGRNLLSTLTQTNKFLEGNSIVDRHTQVMYSREVIIFYIDRRSHAYNISNTITNMARLPTSVAGFERINKEAINTEILTGGNASIEEKLTIGSSEYYLTSAIVAVTDKDIEKGSELVIGSEAIIFTHTVPLATPATASINKYQLGTVHKYSPGTVIKKNVIKVFDSNMTSRAALELINTTGTILIYKNMDFSDKDNALAF